MDHKLSMNALMIALTVLDALCERDDGATGRQPGEIVEGDVPDDFDDELGREFGGGVV